MGVVYEAVQISLNRRVALKVLPFAAVADERQLQRFRIEAQAAALLHHTAHRAGARRRLRAGRALLRHAVHRRADPGPRHRRAAAARRPRGRGPGSPTGAAFELASGLASGDSTRPSRP